MGHPQPPTSIHCENATAVGIVNETIKKHRSRPMEMRYVKSCEQVRRGNFNVQYHPGLECLGDYLYKHHSTAQHITKTLDRYTYTQNNHHCSYQEHQSLVIWEGVLVKQWWATRMGAHCQCSPETYHDFLRDSPLMEFQVEVSQASKLRGTKPVILARHTTLARCTRQDSNLLQVEGCQANNN